MWAPPLFLFSVCPLPPFPFVFLCLPLFSVSFVLDHMTCLYSLLFKTTIYTTFLLPYQHVFPITTYPSPSALQWWPTTALFTSTPFLPILHPPMPPHLYA